MILALLIHFCFFIAKQLLTECKVYVHFPGDHINDELQASVRSPSLRPSKGLCRVASFVVVLQCIQLAYSYSESTGVSGFGFVSLVGFNSSLGASLHLLQLRQPLLSCIFTLRTVIKPKGSCDGLLPLNQERIGYRTTPRRNVLTDAPD